MKIYHKRNFAIGVFLLLFAAVVFTIKWRQSKWFQTSSDSMNTIWLAMLALQSVQIIRRSLSREQSREDKVKERDERNRLVRITAQSRAFEIGQWAFLGLGLALFALGGWGRTSTASTGIGFMLASFLLMLLSFFTAIYYDEKI